MTDNEIIKALEEWLKKICDSYQTSIDLGYVAIATDTEEYISLLRGTLDLINRQKAEKQNLEIELKAMRGAANSYKAEIERLQYDNELAIAEGKAWYDKCQTIKAEARRKCKFIGLGHSCLHNPNKAEAYKECIEKIKAYIDMYEHLTCEECGCVPISKNGLDNLLKEMEGAEDGK